MPQFDQDLSLTTNDSLRAKSDDPLKASISLLDRLVDEAYENPSATWAVGVSAGAVTFLGCRSAALALCRRRATSTLSNSLFYIETKNSGVIPEKAISQGSGFMFTKDGHIATALHVVKDASEITVFTIQGQDFAARMIASDAAHDLAILKLEGTTRAVGTPVTLASGPAGLFGARSVTLGHPGATERQVASYGKLITERKVTGLEARLVKRPEIEGASQLVMDLPVVSGFSGAPIADLKGRVYGLVTEGIVGKRNSRGAPISKLLQLMKESGV